MSPQNPFLIDWSGPFALPPFDQIKDEHFAPAFDAAFEQSRAAINAIADNSAAPTFANTIDALETADELMDKVAGVFFNISGSDSNDARQALQRDLAPRFAAFSSETMMNEALFARIETLNKNRAGNSAEQNRVLDLYHRSFVRRRKPKRQRKNTPARSHLPPRRAWHRLHPKPAQRRSRLVHGTGRKRPRRPTRFPALCRV